MRYLLYQVSAEYRTIQLHYKGKLPHTHLRMEFCLARFLGGPFTDRYRLTII
jgi:hypothetical protein